MKKLSLLTLFAFVGALTASAQSGIGNIINLSARGTVGATSGYLSVGFIVEGTSPKTVLIRGVGPGLAAFGVPGTQADVGLVVYDGGGNVVAANDGYQTAANAADISTAMAELGAFSLSSAGDSAVLVTLAPGSYSVQGVAGAAAVGDGTALVEVYDADVLNGEASGTLIANLSACGVIGQGGSGLALGFVIGGVAPVDIYLHGVGPDLANYGISNAASAVSLAIYDDLGNLIASNSGFFNADNSGDMQAVSSSLGDVALSNPNDSAILVTLQPGAYSVSVSPGTNAPDSVALVEAFDVDGMMGN